MCFLCFFYQVLLTSLSMCFLCFMCFLFFFFKLLSRPFSPCVFVMFLFFPIINFFFLLQKFHFCYAYTMRWCPFSFFPCLFSGNPFFINFILSFSFSFHWQSCCFDFVTLSSFCPQKFALSYLVVVSLFCRILFSYVIVQLFLIATRGIFTSFRIQPNQIVEISPSFLFLLFNRISIPPIIVSPMNIFLENCFTSCQMDVDSGVDVPAP